MLYYGNGKITSSFPKLKKKSRTSLPVVVCSSREDRRTKKVERASQDQTELEAATNRFLDLYD